MEKCYSNEDDNSVSDCLLCSRKFAKFENYMCTSFFILLIYLFVLHEKTLSKTGI